MNLQEGLADTNEVDDPLSLFRAVVGYSMNGHGPSNLFGIHLSHVMLGYSLEQAWTRLNTSEAHELVEDMGKDLVHALLLLESLDGEFYALNEGLLLAVHGLFFRSFLRRTGRLNVRPLKAGGLEHVLGDAVGMLDLVLWNQLCWMS